PCSCSTRRSLPTGAKTMTRPVPMALDDSLLDDPTRLAEADGEDLLRAAAMAGAQVRATVESAAELGLADRLDMGRHRSLVLLTRPGLGPAAAPLLEYLVLVCSPPTV